jgi:hypothetical protein
MRWAESSHDLRQSSQFANDASMCARFPLGMCHARIVFRPGLLVAPAGPRGTDRRPDRSHGMGRCAARRRLPHDPAADPRAEPPRDRSLVQGHRAGPGHRLPQPPAVRRPAHEATLPARPQRQRRSCQRLCGLRRRRPQRLQLHGRAVERHRRQHDQQREPVQRRLGRQLVACGVRGRRRLVGRDADSLAYRADAPGRRQGCARSRSRSTASRCWRSRPMSSACTTPSAARPMPTWAPTCSGSPTASSSSARR